MRPLTFLTALLASVTLTGAEPYDEACEMIIQHARAAASSHNRGDAVATAAAIQAATDAFHHATGMEPREPQAYMHAAQFFHNTHRFDEAIDAWHEADERLASMSAPAPGGGTWEEFVAARVQQSRLGRVSTRRDEVYDEGRGNATAALELAHEQLQLVPGSPRYLHEIATLATGICHRQPELATEAVEYYERAQEAAIAAAAAMVRMRDATACPASARMVSSDEMGSNSVVGVEVAAGVGGGYVATLHDAIISGNAGVISWHQGCELRVLGTGDAPYTALHEQLMTEPPRGPEDVPRPPRALQRAASLAGFASGSYFHFVHGVLPRLALLLPYLYVDLEMPILVPMASGKARENMGGFVGGLLGLVLPADWLKTRVKAYNTNGHMGERLRVQTLLWADWARTAAADASPTHCLPDAHALRAAAALFVTDVKTTWQRRQPGVVVYAARGGKASLRQLDRRDEEALLVALRAVTERQHPPIKFVVFEGDSASAADTLDLFEKAVAVVGVHGGALANLFFCSRGALVIELGSVSPFARHYAHVAASLGLKHHMVAAGVGVGAAQVNLSAEVIASAAATLDNSFRPEETLRNRPTSHGPGLPPLTPPASEKVPESSMNGLRYRSSVGEAMDATSGSGAWLKASMKRDTRDEL